jgi:phosphonate transport system substrate-binding protein
MKGRSWVFTLLAASVAALVLAGCGREAHPRLALDTRPVLNFGFLPYSDEDHMRGLYDALAGYLSPALEMELHFILMRDYEAVGHLMENKMVDIAWFTPASYVAIGRKIGARPIVKPFRRGRDRYRAIVVVREESRYRTVADLRGARFAYVDRNSTSGFVAPNEMLARAGLGDPLAFFSTVEFSFSHSASLRGLADGRYDAAAVYEGAPADSADKLGGVRLRTIAVGPEIPNDPIAGRSGLDPALVERIRALLLTMHGSPTGATGLEALEKLERISRFVQASDADYRW